VESLKLLYMHICDTFTVTVESLGKKCTTVHKKLLLCCKMPEFQAFATIITVAQSVNESSLLVFYIAFQHAKIATSFKQL